MCFRLCWPNVLIPNLWGAWTKTVQDSRMLRRNPLPQEKKCSRSQCPSNKCQSERVCLLQVGPGPNSSKFHFPTKLCNAETIGNQHWKMTFNTTKNSPLKVAPHFGDHFSLTSVRWSGTMADVCGAFESCGSRSPCLLATHRLLESVKSVNFHQDEITKQAEKQSYILPIYLMYVYLHCIHLLYFVVIKLFLEGKQITCKHASPCI